MSAVPAGRPAPALRLNEPLLHGPDGGFRAVAGFELPENVLDVLFHGLDADVERATDLTVRQPESHMAQDLYFAIGERDVLVIGRATTSHRVPNFAHDAIRFGRQSGM